MTEGSVIRQPIIRRLDLTSVCGAGYLPHPEAFQEDRWVLMVLDRSSRRLNPVGCIGVSGIPARSDCVGHDQLPWNRLYRERGLFVRRAFRVRDVRAEAIASNIATCDRASRCFLTQPALAPMERHCQIRMPAEFHGGGRRAERSIKRRDPARSAPACHPSRHRRRDPSSG
jgi:hypothetical protein